MSRPRVANPYGPFPLLVLLAVALPAAARAQQITRPELKSISAPAYFAGSGIQLTEAIANDIATLKVDMVRVELIGQNDAAKTICYSAYDRIVDRLAARQIKVLGLIDYQSIAWASTTDFGTDAFRPRFVARVQEIVGHYSARANPIRHWEIWNEEDICVAGYCPRIEPEPYGRILVDVYHAIKAIDPGATVVLGGISPKGFEYPPSNYLSDVYGTTALQNHHALYGYHPFDAVGAHPYAETFTSPNPGLANVLDNRVKAVMNANGDAAKKVWLTEMGWNSSQVSEASQASYLTQSYQMMDTHTDPAYPANGPYVERYFWFAYQDFGTLDLWGLWTADLSRAKPAYTAYKNLGPSSVTKPIPPPEGSMPGLTRESAANPLTLSIQPDPADPLNGILATRLAGGFHPANTNPADHEPAFTDGAGLGALTGLLADYPGQDTPAWSGFWLLAGGSPADLREMRVFSGNTGKDGRVFHHYDLYVTSDPAPSASSAWTRVKEQVTSAAFGTSNASHSIKAMLTRLSDPVGGNLATGITALRLDFHAVSNNDNQFHDDWDACNGDDCDGAVAAFQSPLIYEVDAYFGPANRPPVLGMIGDRSVNEAATLSFTVSATDADGDPLTYSASNLPTGATFDPATRTFSWTPGYDQAGTYPGVTFRVTDDGTPNLSDSEAIAITVNDVNRAPVLAAIGDQTVMEGNTLSFTVSATDADGDTLTYSASNLPTGATFTPATRTFSWTPSYDQAGSYPAVVFSVADAATTDSQSITITVSDNPTPPGYFTVVPCRVVDTRWAAGPFGGPALLAGADRMFSIVTGACSIPTSATAVSVNLTVTGATAAGNLRLYPDGNPLPLVSSINYVPGVTRANNAIVPLGGLGGMVVHCSQASGTVHFILDVNGYFQGSDP